MIDPRHRVLSITRQCALIGISRSAWYGPGRTETPLNLALMKLIDAQFMETPFYGSRQPLGTSLRDALPASGWQGICASNARKLVMP